MSTISQIIYNLIPAIRRYAQITLSFAIIRRADAASFLEDIQGRSSVYHRGSSGLIGET